MRSASEIIAPHHCRLASCKDALMLVQVAYLMFHYEAGATNVYHSDTYLNTIRSYQGKRKGAGDFFNKESIVTPTWACLNAWVMRWV